MITEKIPIAADVTQTVLLVESIGELLIEPFKEKAHEAGDNYVILEYQVYAQEVLEQVNPKFSVFSPPDLLESMALKYLSNQSKLFTHVRINF